MAEFRREERRRTAAVRGVLEESRRSLLAEFWREERERTAATEQGVLGGRRKEESLDGLRRFYSERGERGGQLFWGRGYNKIRYRSIFTEFSSGTG